MKEYIKRLISLQRISVCNQSNNVTLTYLKYYIKFLGQIEMMRCEEMMVKLLERNTSIKNSFKNTASKNYSEMKTSEMNLELLKKNKEILENTQSRFKRWLKIAFDNVIFFSDEKQRLIEQYLSFDSYEK